MYADREEALSRTSIKERLKRNAADDSARRRLISGKRLREDDDKWVHDLYEPDELQGSNQRIGTKDLRLKLQRRRSIQQATQIIKSSLSGGTRDLREKLSGTVYSQTMQTGAPKKKLKTIPEVSKPSKRSVVAEAPASETKNIASKVSKKKSQQKEYFMLPELFNVAGVSGSIYRQFNILFQGSKQLRRLLPICANFSLPVESVDSFLQSLGLEKYAVTFQAEEVDMAALLHMTDEDLKAMGIPMGPRKKILLALESKV